MLAAGQTGPLWGEQIRSHF